MNNNTQYNTNPIKSNNKICKQCDTIFEYREINDKFCSRECGIKYHTKSIKSNNNNGKLCKNCHKKQCYSGFEFCSRFCGRSYNNNGKLCKNCHKKQCYSGYEFCGKTCGRSYNNNNNSNTKFCRYCQSKTKVICVANGTATATICGNCNNYY